MHLIRFIVPESSPRNNENNLSLTESQSDPQISQINADQRETRSSLRVIVRAVAEACE
jgi:hypothetical protein